MSLQTICNGNFSVLFFSLILGCCSNNFFRFNVIPFAVWKLFRISFYFQETKEILRRTKRMNNLCKFNFIISSFIFSSLVWKTECKIIQFSNLQTGKRKLTFEVFLHFYRPWEDKFYL